MSKTSEFISRRWGWLAVGAGAALFVGLATLPYIKASTSLMARGEPLSMVNLQHQVKMDEKAAKEAQKMAKGVGKGEKQAALEIKHMAVLADGTVLAGGKYGLFQIGQDGRTTEFKSPVQEVKALALAPDGSLWVVDKHSVHRLHEGKWSQHYNGKADAMGFAGDGTIYLGSKHIGLILSRDSGKTWQTLVEPTEDEKKKSDHDHANKKKSQEDGGVMAVMKSH